MSSTKQVVRNAAAALKKAADPWSKEGRVNADRVASAAISVIDATSLSHGVLDMLSSLLRRPFAELYSTHPGTSLRLSAAILGTIIHDRIAPSWKSGDSQSKNDWEQVLPHSQPLLTTSTHPPHRIMWKVKTTSENGGSSSFLFNSVQCVLFCIDTHPVNKIFGPTSSIREYPVCQGVAGLQSRSYMREILKAYSLLSTTADSCLENKDKLRDNKILGGARYHKDERLLSSGAASHIVGIPITQYVPYGGTEQGKELIDLLKYVASPDWEITSDKIVDILARDISVTQPFVMNSFALRGVSGTRPSPVHRFYLDKTSILFNFEDEAEFLDDRIEGMHVPYSSVEHVNISSSGTVAAQLGLPPLCHDSLQMLSNGAAIQMTVVLSPPDVERFARTLRVRGMTSRIKLDGVLTRKAAQRISVNRSPTRLEFDLNAKSSASYQNKVKAIEKGDVHENPEQYSTTASLTLGPPPPPSCPDDSSLHPPGTPGIAHQCFDVDNPALAHSPPSEHSQHSCHSNKELSDAIFGASDEELSSLSDADSVLGNVRVSAELVQPRRIRRRTGSSKRCTRSQRPRNTPLSTRPIPTISSLDPSPDAAAEQKLVPVVKGLRVMDSQDTMREKLLDAGGQNPTALAKRKKILIESGDELQATSLESTSKESPLPTTSGGGPKDQISQTKRRNAVAAGRTAIERPKRSCVLSSKKTQAGPKPLPSVTPKQPDLDKGDTEKGPGGDDESADDEPPRGKPAKMVAEERVTARVVELKRPNTEDIPSVSDSAKPRKRARVDRETVALARKKPTRNKGTSVIKSESSRVRKTYRRRQKTEWSSPGHSATCDVDYDEVPPSTIQLSSLVTNGRDLPATDTVTTVPIPRALRMKGKTGKITPTEPQVVTKPTVEIPNDQKCGNIGKPKERDPCAQIQSPPTASLPEDDDPIQSFSSSPHSPSLLSVDVAKSAPDTPTTGDDDVLGSLPGVQSLTKPVDPASCANAQTCNPKREAKEREFDKDMQKTGDFSHENTLQHSTALSDHQPPQPNPAPRSASMSPPRGPVRPAPDDVSPGITPSDNGPSAYDRNDDNARGSSNPFTDLDSADGPTIVVEQPSVDQKGNADTTFSLMPETIDLTNDTPSPISSPRSGPQSLGRLPSSHHVSTSSPVVSKGDTSENTGSSVLDLADTKYRDFDVSLDSSYCLPSIRTSVLKRSPTPPPPRTKQKNVTFALPFEEVDDEPLEILAAPVEAIATTVWKETDEFEHPKLAFEPPQGNGPPSSVDRFPCLGPQFSNKPHAIHPSPIFSPRVEKVVVSRPEPFSPFALRRNRSRLSEVTLSMELDTKHGHSTRDALLSPAMVEPTERGDYLASIMAILDQIHAIVKSNIQARFESVTSDVAKLRRQILAQTQTDMTALLDEYINAFNNLVNLEAKYGAFSKRRITAFAQARNANVQGLAFLRTQIQAHDRAAQEHLQRALVIGPLPAAVRRWL
ncbi:hypothetical protein EI94DRAFT_1801158 [Lactarius quietus]|nr:hypothetical protein EI94DRAFT_1801158 [Lactarius quietus]